MDYIAPLQCFYRSQRGPRSGAIVGLQVRAAAGQPVDPTAGVITTIQPQSPPTDR